MDTFLFFSVSEYYSLRFILAAGISDNVGADHQPLTRKDSVSICLEEFVYVT